MANNQVLVLRARADFLRLNKIGKKSNPCRWLTLYGLANSNKDFRVGYTLSRKIGTAVTRNRLRRWCREYFRVYRHNQPQKIGIDIHVVFRPRDGDFFKKLKHEDLDFVLTQGLHSLQKNIFEGHSSD